MLINDICLQLHTLSTLKTCTVHKIIWVEYVYVGFTLVVLV